MELEEENKVMYDELQELSQQFEDGSSEGGFDAETQKKKFGLLKGGGKLLKGGGKLVGKGGKKVFGLLKKGFGKKKKDKEDTSDQISED